MKTISILKKLINIYYYLILISLVGTVFGIGVFFLTRNKEMNPKILGTYVDFNKLTYPKIIIVLIIIIVLYYVYIKAINLLRNSLGDLSSGNYFSELIINNFNKIGKLFLFSSVIELVGKIIFGFLLEAKFKFELDSSMFLFLIMGLFFLFLSEVFAKAKRIEEENDLTI
ncbi:DUF2975 domain-containing protein [Tenacibaculum caenipelagi]|uniref:DUF2975 family protein n=1 Tax=Tenacibaculum caenipelagi TaxID=1325435 RepID=A0A4R6TAL3_9FLAO|nr:DUF2975 domain-containing protein [Tenacibaculum caenipelagi]TDQ21994.1 DUF2975 family protein [Tenacibaculum caenipelagi]